jgi:tetratricopeptide (TPR) repeat protein
MMWAVAIAIVAAVLVLVLVVRARASRGLENRIRQALADRDYDTAADLLRDLNNRRPSAENRYRLAAAYVEGGRYPFAIVELKQIARSETAPPKLRAAALEQTAVCHRALGHTDDAVQAYRDAIALSPANRALQVALVDVYIESGKLDRAAAVLQELTDKAGRRADVLYRLGIVCARKGHHEDAVTHLRASLEADPRYVEPHFELGAVLENTGKFEDAASEYRKSLKAKALRLASFLGIARCLLAAGNRVDAVKTLEQATYAIEVDNDPTALEIRYLLAGCYEANSNLTAAVEQWRSIAQVQADYQDVVEKLRSNARYAKDRLLDYEIATEGDFLRAVRNISRILGYTPLSVRKASNEEVNVTATNDATGGDALLIFFRATPVGEKRVAHVFDLKQSSGFPEVLIVSSSPVTANAKHFARSRGIRIIGRQNLAPLLKEHERTAEI